MLKALQLSLINRFKNKIRSHADQVLGANPCPQLVIEG
jgi:hypothetical protein